jgi:hypothetical protein
MSGVSITLAGDAEFVSVWNNIKTLTSAMVFYNSGVQEPLIGTIDAPATTTRWSAKCFAFTNASDGACITAFTQGTGSAPTSITGITGIIHCTDALLFSVSPY